MRRSRELPELLAPAGDFDALRAAVLAGADAVYIGGARFGARAYAKNFDDSELSEAIRYAHLWGVRVYVTLNTLVYDRELDEATEYAKKLHAMGVDALIVADVGICMRLRRELPELELHASTQMGAHNTAGVDFARSLGCKRVVLARECNYEDICKIIDSSAAECEVFVHGALCVCHSGQCLFSSMVGGRSGNRGECAQPCRLPYGKGYPLSLNDLSLSEHITKLIESGVSSLKIEGRMKSAQYVYAVTSIYRRLLDEHRNSNPAERQRLADVFSRGGFTDGYFVANTQKRMTGIRSEAEKQRSRELSDTDISTKKLPVYMVAEFRQGKPARLTLTADVCSRWDNSGSDKKINKKTSVTVTGDIPYEAKTAPMTKEGVAERLSKMGGTPFAAENISVILDEGLNLPFAAINALRRCATEKLLSEYAKPIDVLVMCDKNVHAPRVEELSYPEKTQGCCNKNTALFFNFKLAEQLCNEGVLCDTDIIFVPLFSYKELDNSARGRIYGVYLPPVIMESEWSSVRRELECAVALGAEYALVGNISHIALIKDLGISAVGDFRLNISNRISYNLWTSVGIIGSVVSPELTLPMARDVGGAVIAMGRIPLMLTERCFIRENFGCERCSRVALTDRTGAKFPIMREYRHRNVIFNSVHTYMGDKFEQLRQNNIKSVHFIFSNETAEEARMLISAFGRGVRPDIPIRRVGKNNGMSDLARPKKSR